MKKNQIKSITFKLVIDPKLRCSLRLFRFVDDENNWENALLNLRPNWGDGNSDGAAGGVHKILIFGPDEP